MSIFMHKVAASLLVVFLLSTSLSVSANGNTTRLAFAANPNIEQNPNPKVPLAAIVSLETHGASKLLLTIDDGDRQWNIEKPIDSNVPLQIPLLGMRADKNHTIQVTIFDQDEQPLVFKEKLSYKTPPLPTDRYVMPRYKVVTSDVERTEPGIIILSVRRSLLVRPQDRTKEQQKFVTGYGMLLGLDNEGEVVWYYKSEQRISGIDRLRNGNIIYHLNTFESVEIDMLGNKINSWYAEKRPQGKPKDESAVAIKDMQTLHHQPHEVRDGSFLSFSANSRKIENWYTNEYDPKPRKTQNVMGDTIIEFDRNGDILWSWNTFDYLDVYQIGYEAFHPYWVTRGFPNTWDWTHGNGVSYDGRDDSVIASFKLLDAIIKIDRESKDIKWIFGDHKGWDKKFQDKLLTPIGNNFGWPYHQHNPRWTEKGTLLVFNNNRGNTKPFDGQPQVPFEESISYTAEYEIDEKARTVRQVWDSKPLTKEDACSSWAMSEAHRLPVTNNILEIHALCIRPAKDKITWDTWERNKRFVMQLPHGGRVREYTHTSPAEVIFEVSFADPAGALAWQVYGGFKTPSLYLNNN